MNAVKSVYEFNTELYQFQKIKQVNIANKFQFFYGQCKMVKVNHTFENLKIKKKKNESNSVIVFVFVFLTQAKVKNMTSNTERHANENLKIQEVTSQVEK